MWMLLFHPSAKSDRLAHPYLAMKLPARDACQAEVTRGSGRLRGVPDPPACSCCQSSGPHSAALHPHMPSCTYSCACQQGAILPALLWGQSPFHPLPPHPVSSVSHNSLPSWWWPQQRWSFLGTPCTQARAPPWAVQVTNPMPKSCTERGSSLTCIKHLCVTENWF